MTRAVLTALFLALSADAAAAPWQSMSVLTAEGHSLTVEKKGRGNYKFRIEADGGDGIKCGGFYGQLRTPLALSLKTAGTRATSDTQMGSIVSYQDALTAFANSQAASMPGLCALGIDAQAGSVVLTLGSALKMQGRTATLTAEDSTKLGEWLIEK